MAETAASIGKPLPQVGNATPVRPGRPSRAPRRLRWSNMPSATAWVNSALTTFGHSAAVSRIPRGALPMQAAAVTAKSTFASLPVQRPNFVESNLATAFIGIALENLG